eukprot:COSAG01_NODE_592_length_15109_cov_39.247435_15_plen_39_part_00
MALREGQQLARITVNLYCTVLYILLVAFRPAAVLGCNS